MKPFLACIFVQSALLAQLVISPASVTITGPGQRIQFACLGCATQVWALNGPGLISPTGLYTAPQILPQPPTGQNFTTVQVQVRDGALTAIASLTLPKPSGVPPCQTCPAGPQGPIGQQGVPGLAGKDGLPGIQGLKGDTGPQGPAGVCNGTCTSGTTLTVKPGTGMTTLGPIPGDANPTVFVGADSTLTPSWTNSIQFPPSGDCVPFTLAVDQPNGKLYACIARGVWKQLVIAP